MSTIYFLGALAGGGSATAQVDRFTPATVEIGDIFTLTITGEDGITAAINFTASATTVANVTAGLTAAWNASTNNLVAAITAADVTTSMTLTSDTAGVPFSVAATTTDGGGNNTQTLAKAAVTANKGANDWSTAVNWSGGAVPVSTDTVILDGRAANSILYGLNQSAVTLTKLLIYKSMPYNVGTVNGPLRVSATTLQVNVPPTDGSSPAGAAVINVDTGTNQTLTEVFGSRNTGTSGMDPVMVKGAHASNVLRVYGGTCGAATNKPADTANYPTVYLSGTGTKLTLASGNSAVTTLTQDGGSLLLRCAATTINQNAGTLLTDGSGAITTLNANAAASLNSTGTITTLNVKDGGSIDTTQTPRAATITTTNVYGSGKLKTNRNTTYTNGVSIYQGATSDQVIYPDGTTITASAAP